MMSKLISLPIVKDNKHIAVFRQVAKLIYLEQSSFQAKTPCKVYTSVSVCFENAAPLQTCHLYCIKIQEVFISTVCLSKVYSLVWSMLRDLYQSFLFLCLTRSRSHPFWNPFYSYWWLLGLAIPKVLNCHQKGIYT